MLQKFWSYLFGRSSAQHYTDSSNWLSVVCSIVFIILSVFRTLALYHSEYQILKSVGPYIPRIPSNLIRIQLIYVALLQ